MMSLTRCSMSAIGILSFGKFMNRERPGPLARDTTR
jgi:hypothetical protein